MTNDIFPTAEKERSGAVMKTVYAMFSAMEIDILQALGFTITTEENGAFAVPHLHLVTAEPEKIAPYNDAQLTYGNVYVRLYRMCSETFYRLHIGLPNGSCVSVTTDLDNLLLGLGEEETKAMIQKWKL